MGAAMASKAPQGPQIDFPWEDYPRKTNIGMGSQSSVVAQYIEIGMGGGSDLLARRLKVGMGKAKNVIVFDKVDVGMGIVDTLHCHAQTKIHVGMGTVRNRVNHSLEELVQMARSKAGLQPSPMPRDRAAADSIRNGTPGSYPQSGPPVGAYPQGYQPHTAGQGYPQQQPQQQYPQQPYGQQAYPPQHQQQPYPQQLQQASYPAQAYNNRAQPYPQQAYPPQALPANGNQHPYAASVTSSAPSAPPSMTTSGDLPSYDQATADVAPHHSKPIL
eukprot:TRINITY_DN14497_c0_g1_i1.p1 TRINITY_DN14497_c0_g1~~TRINITY_DN14497_c0_g1_i1.p1  ORF type:complete len:273 (+),score=35.67 TRINITY_DN14497_c0_g1_i1:64-882(+)